MSILDPKMSMLDFGTRASPYEFQPSAPVPVLSYRRHGIASIASVKIRDTSQGTRAPPNGPLDAYFFKYLAGICPTKPGYETFRVKPRVRNSLTHTAATVKTVRGVISCRWSKEGKTGFNLAVTVPVNGRATIHVPTLGVAPDAVIISESESVIWNRGTATAGAAAGVEFVGTESGYVIFQVGSGAYQFTCRQ